jgi:hypothetical protein
MGLGDEQVEPFDEAAVAGGFLAPAAGGGVGGECFGVGALQLQPGGHDAPVPNSTPSVSGRYPAGGGGAVALAATDPHRAARLSADAERIAQSITSENLKIVALVKIAEAWNQG